MQRKNSTNNSREQRSRSKHKVHERYPIQSRRKANIDGDSYIRCHEESQVTIVGASLLGKFHRLRFVSMSTCAVCFCSFVFSDATSSRSRGHLPPSRPIPELPEDAHTPPLTKSIKLPPLGISPRKAAPSSNGDVPHKSRNASLPKPTPSRSRSRTQNALELHAHYSPPLPSTNSSSTTQRRYAFAPFSNPSTTQQPKDTFDLLETSDDSDILDLVESHRPQLKRSTSALVGAGAIGGGGTGRLRTREFPNLNGVHARGIHKSAGGTPSVPDIAEYSSEDDSSVVASVHALLARHKEVTSKSSSNRPRSRENGINSAAENSKERRKLRVDASANSGGDIQGGILGLDVDKRRARSQKRNRVGRSRKSRSRSPVGARARGGSRRLHLEKVNSDPTPLLDDDVISPLDIARLPMSIQKRR